MPPGIGWGESGRILLLASFLAGSGGPYLIGAAGVGRLTIAVDGATVADESTSIPADPVEAMTRPGEVRAVVSLQANGERREPTRVYRYPVARLRQSAHMSRWVRRLPGARSY